MDHSAALGSSTVPKGTNLMQTNPINKAVPMSVTVPAWVCAREPGSMQWVSRSPRRPYRRAIGWLIGVIVPREIAAGVAPAHRNSKFATLTGGLAHDVSILPGVGRHLGWQPRQAATRQGPRRLPIR